MITKPLYQIIITLSIAGLLLPNFAFAVDVNQPPKMPETLGEAETLGAKILKSLPQALKEPWQEALRVWGRMWSWAKGIWDSYILPWLQGIWQSLFGKKIIKERKEIFEKEFEKEKKEIKEEIKTELPKTTKSLWQRFKELIR